MKLFRKLKKGFTLVELVVVIAVIAILAAASVVTYIGVTNNAKKSTDAQVLQQVNNALILRETNEGEKPSTMYDALNVLNEDLGVSNLEKLLSASYKNYEFAYDLEANRFVLLDGTKVAEAHTDYSVESAEGIEYKFWKFASSFEATDKFSHYCSDAFTGAINTCSGVDVGNNEDITIVNYTNTTGAKSVVIRTGTIQAEMNINGPEDTVSHYGLAGNLYIKDIASESYHEYGRIAGTCVIEEGHVVVEDGGNIGTLVVDTEQTGDVSLDTEGSGTVGMLLGTSQEVVDEVSGDNNITQEPEVTTTEQIEVIKNATLFNKRTNVFYNGVEGIKTAISEIEDGDELVLIRDTETVYNNGFINLVDKELTLDTNGHVLFGTSQVAVSSEFIKVDKDSKLTLKDSTDINKDGTGSGLITNDASASWSWNGDLTDFSSSFTNNLLVNYGVLTIESGCYKNTSEGSAAYCIDNYSGGKIVVSGGRLETAFASAIRCFYNTVGEVTVSGKAYLKSGQKFALQAMGGAPTMNLNGGTFEGSYSLATYVAANSIWNINGGTYLNAIGISSNYITIAGGKFFTSISTEYSQYIAEGKAIVAENNYWVVK